jgi:hypothetical protein
LPHTSISMNIDDVAAGNPPGTGNHHLIGSIGAGFHVTRIEVRGVAERVPLNNPSTTIPFEVNIVAAVQWVPFGATPPSIIGSPDSAGMLWRRKIFSNNSNFIWQTGSTTWQAAGDPIEADLRMQWLTPQAIDLYFATASDEGSAATRWLLYAESRIVYV